MTAGATSQATPWRRAFAVLENFDASEVWSEWSELRGFDDFFSFLFVIQTLRKGSEGRKGGKDVEFIPFIVGSGTERTPVACAD